jgi:hypothetical protein
MQVRGLAPAIRMPAFPLQPVCLENRLEDTVSEVVQIQRPANRVGEHPAGCIFWLDGFKDGSKRLDNWNDAGVFLILVRLGLILQMRPPNRTPDVQIVPIVVFPPLPSNFALREIETWDVRIAKTGASFRPLKSPSANAAVGLAPQIADFDDLRLLEFIN